MTRYRPSSKRPGSVTSAATVASARRTRRRCATRSARRWPAPALRRTTSVTSSPPRPARPSPTRRSSRRSARSSPGARTRYRSARSSRTSGTWKPRPDCPNSPRCCCSCAIARSRRRRCRLVRHRWCRGRVPVCDRPTGSASGPATGRGALWSTRSAPPARTGTRYCARRSPVPVRRSRMERSGTSCRCRRRPTSSSPRWPVGCTRIWSPSGGSDGHRASPTWRTPCRPAGCSSGAGWRSRRPRWTS